MGEWRRVQKGWYLQILAIIFSFLSLPWLSHASSFTAAFAPPSLPRAGKELSLEEPRREEGKSAAPAYEASLEETVWEEGEGKCGPRDTGPPSLPWDGPLHSRQGHPAVVGSAPEQE